MGGRLGHRTPVTPATAPAVGDIVTAPADAMPSRYWQGAPCASHMLPGERAVVIGLSPLGWHLQRVTDGALFTLDSATNRTRNGARPWRVSGFHTDADGYADAPTLPGLDCPAVA